VIAPFDPARYPGPRPGGPTLVHEGRTHPVELATGAQGVARADAPVAAEVLDPHAVRWAGRLRLDVEVGEQRSSQVGIHQLRSPSRTMVEGTSATRTMVASMNTATARPRPICWMMMLSPSANPMNTTIMISAAEVMTRAVLEMPATTLSVLSPDRRYSSRVRESRNTS
jgi:hypothetical protein